MKWETLFKYKCFANSLLSSHIALSYDSIYLNIMNYYNKELDLIYLVELFKKDLLVHNNLLQAIICKYSTKTAIKLI